MQFYTVQQVSMGLGKLIARAVQKFIQWNIKISQACDRMLPEKYRIDGNRFFLDHFAPAYLEDDLIIYDVGGGKHPYINVSLKNRLNLNITGLDIDQNEHDRAPEGTYDRKICADITRFRGNSDADLVICQALLEHVRNVDQAFVAIASILKPGGRALIFVPSRNALYTRLNLLLPQNLKKRLLHTIYPKTRESQGFPSYYNQCTPREFRRIAQKHNLIVEQESFHYISSYFSFFFPLYLLWRIWILGFHALAGEQAAEAFCMALKKNP